MSIDSLDLFVFGTGLGEKSNLNFCFKISKPEHKIDIFKFIKPLLEEDDTFKPTKKEGKHASLTL